MHLKTAFSQELISGAEWYLNYGCEFCHFFCGVILYICNTLNHGCGDRGLGIFDGTGE
jgi:hypothetical protein